MKITIPVSIGEFLDKISILEIKFLLSDDEYVIKELNELNKIKSTLTQYTAEYMEQLREVNKKLWKVEDKLRKLEKEQKFDDEFIELSRSVYKLNDERADIKKRINEEMFSEIKEVKLY